MWALAFLVERLLYRLLPPPNGGQQKGPEPLLKNKFRAAPPHFSTRGISPLHFSSLQFLSFPIIIFKIHHTSPLLYIIQSHQTPYLYLSSVTSTYFRNPPLMFEWKGSVKEVNFSVLLRILWRLTLKFERIFVEKWIKNE